MKLWWLPQGSRFREIQGLAQIDVNATCVALQIFRDLTHVDPLTSEAWVDCFVNQISTVGRDDSVALFWYRIVDSRVWCANWSCDAIKGLSSVREVSLETGVPERDAKTTGEPPDNGQGVLTLTEPSCPVDKLQNSTRAFDRWPITSGYTVNTLG